MNVQLEDQLIIVVMKMGNAFVEMGMQARSALNVILATFCMKYAQGSSKKRLTCNDF